MCGFSQLHLSAYLPSHGLWDALVLSQPQPPSIWQGGRVGKDNEGKFVGPQERGPPSERANMGEASQPKPLPCWASISSSTHQGLCSLNTVPTFLKVPFTRQTFFFKHRSILLFLGFFFLVFVVSGQPHTLKALTLPQYMCRVHRSTSSGPGAHQRQFHRHSLLSPLLSRPHCVLPTAQTLLWVSSLSPCQTPSSFGSYRRTWVL